MHEIYASHDVLIAAPLRESVGVQLLEAMLSGVPVLTLNLHGAALFVPDGGGIKVDVTTPEATKQALAEALDGLCRNPQSITRMREVALEAARAYIWPNKIKRICTYYDG